ncbi:hypothetical protein V7S57_09750 [Caulobacter sp. CCNWLY153]|uniref:Spore coat protein U domain-containing protein n=1 Tax=Caulobacter radicis TaxID=2172650 RepID=A0A2T9JYI3_9CAUL|nr:hypothetical protein [Caulobacter radicis]PVM88769.1 hypothetical protein DDF65_01080 [Caulobacter radicis]
MRFPMILAAAFTALAATTASAAPASYELRLEGHVPVICRVSLDATTASSAEPSDLGRMTEFCNSASGYEVRLTHAQGLNDAAVYVDGQKIQLSSTGVTLISRSSTAASQSHSLRLDPGADAGQVGDLSVNITAL